MPDRKIVGGGIGKGRREKKRISATLSQGSILLRLLTAQRLDAKLGTKLPARRPDVGQDG